MSSVGETLRSERLRRDLSLEQISRETKISPRLLDAIENEQFDKLPGGVFARSFVRQYARTLGLDEEELAAEVQRAVQPLPDQPVFGAVPPQPEFRVPKLSHWESGGSHSTSSALPSLALVVALMFLCSGIYALWQRSRRPAAPARAVPAAQTNPAPAEPKPAVPAAAAVSNHPATPSRTEVAQAVPAVPSTSTAPLQVSMTAGEPTWVRAWADGKEVLTATLEPNVVKSVEASNEIRVRTGNAGGLQITLNGKPVGPVGPRGQIRVVQITPSGVQSLEPPKPAPEPVLEDPL